MKNSSTIHLYPLVILGAFLLLSTGCKKDDENKPPETVTDIDGNVYHTVTIGTQVWLIENLKVTRYRNGDSIPNITDTTQWNEATSGAYCIYNNDETIVGTFGHLYNWYAINDTRSIAPQGWHIPSDVEWSTLINYLGGGDVAGGKMKEPGTTHWQTPNTGATNSSGLNVLPGGCRFDGSFSYLSSHAIFWTSTAKSTASAYYRSLAYGSEGVYRTTYSAKQGLSVRCMMD